MSKLVRRFFAACLILITFCIPFLIINPNLYSGNNAGKIYKEVNLDFTFLKKENKKFVLLYFGYIGCSNICPPAMEQINQIYNKIDKKRFGFYFINLLPNGDPDMVKAFAEAFNKDFNGVYLNNKEIRKIVSSLNVKYLPSLFDKNELEHSGFLYLLEKNVNSYTLKFIYTASPFDIEYISNDLKRI